MFSYLQSKHTQKSLYMIVKTIITKDQLSFVKFPITESRSLHTGPSEVLEFIHSCRRTKRIYQLPPPPPPPSRQAYERTEKVPDSFFFMFEFPCIITLYYIKNQQDATLAVLFISHCKITLHVSDAFCVHNQEY